MHCIVTAGPTFERLDEVRRLTNFSTGRLGTELANFLTAQGHDVMLLIGEQAVWRGERQAKQIEIFSTTADLRERLKEMSGAGADAVFHAAAVSDFGFGKIWQRSEGGDLTEVVSGKLSTREGRLLAELVPTPKIIVELRDWYPRARLIGWKYEVEGGREQAIALAKKQIVDCRTDGCVVNGRAYGEGFGLVASGGSRHLVDERGLFEVLEKMVGK
jgi:phosphopantothenate---cysteine ligase (CTP)